MRSGRSCSSVSGERRASRTGSLHRAHSVCRLSTSLLLPPSALGIRWPIVSAAAVSGSPGYGSVEPTPHTTHRQWSRSKTLRRAPIDTVFEEGLSPSPGCQPIASNRYVPVGIDRSSLFVGSSQPLSRSFRRRRFRCSASLGTTPSPKASRISGMVKCSPSSKLNAIQAANFLSAPYFCFGLSGQVVNSHHSVVPSGA